MFIYDYAKEHQPIRKQDKLQITDNKGTSTHKSYELRKKITHVFTYYDFWNQIQIIIIKENREITDFECKYTHKG